ncbi:hypothetical protein GOP47_0000614 [Adiantum capillus-veneris]|uniref:Uncharacterized protein n=1 Tax=Adiantum capillus-veneris TaxID=13818 RepID=A0A9D4ZT87_ADICA|nr:hypothetical protein GOP47_0000614 [Adiantum capillus-veneris]
MATGLRTAARRVICITQHRASHLPGVPRAAQATRKPPSHGHSQDIKLISQRRLRGAFGMGESLMPMHSATAAASLVSKLCNGNNLLEGAEICPLNMNAYC